MNLRQIEHTRGDPFEIVAYRIVGSDASFVDGYLWFLSGRFRDEVPMTG